MSIFIIKQKKGLTTFEILANSDEKTPDAFRNSSDYKRLIKTRLVVDAHVESIVMVGSNLKDLLLETL